MFLINKKKEREITMNLENILEMSDSEKIKLYTQRYKDSSEKEKREIKRTDRKTTLRKYEVLLSSGLDAVIERRTKTSQCQFLFMPSQDKYLFKKGKIVQDVKTTGYEDFKSFFSDLSKSDIVVNNVTLSSIKQNNLKNLYEMILDYSKELHEGTMSLDLYSSGEFFCKNDIGKITGTVLDEISSLAERDKLLKMITTKTPILTNQSKYNKEFLLNVISIYKQKGYDVARTFVESYTKSSMTKINSHVITEYWRGYDDSGDIQIGNLFKYRVEPKQLIEYLCFGLYAQGFREIPLEKYRHYLMISNDVDGKVKDKYPDCFLTAYDVISLKYRLNKKEIDKNKFKKTYEDFENLFKITDKKMFNFMNYSIVLPTEPQDLINEGSKLGICVGSYVPHVANAKCVIVFVRSDAALDEPYLTVELRPINEFGKLNYSIAQIQGDNKRTTLTKDEINFFKKFMNETGLRSGNQNLM